MTLDEARNHLGAHVIYKGFFDIPASRSHGVITSVGDQYIYVRYDYQQPDANGQATYPNDLQIDPDYDTEIINDGEITS